MKIKLIILLSFTVKICCGQITERPDELYGFRLGQYKKTVLNELGKPYETRALDDSSTVDLYCLYSDSSAYMAFQYYPSAHPEIYSIQLSGTRAERSFYGINLGDSINKAISILGKPDTMLIQDYNEKKLQVLKYTEWNISLLIENNKVGSIKIWDQRNVKDYKYPSFKEILDIISTKDTLRICNILSPNIEIYYCDNIITWKNSFYTDTRNSKGLFEFILNNQYGLISLSSLNNLKPVENIRLIEGVGTFPVFKFPAENIIQEIVLNFQQGRFKIYEIKYRCQEN